MIFIYLPKRSKKETSKDIPQRLTSNINPTSSSNIYFTCPVSSSGTVSSESSASGSPRRRWASRAPGAAPPRRRRGPSPSRGSGRVGSRCPRRWGRRGAHHGTYFFQNRLTTSVRKFANVLQYCSLDLQKFWKETMIHLLFVYLASANLLQRHGKCKKEYIANLKEQKNKNKKMKTLKKN